MVGISSVIGPSIDLWIIYDFASEKANKNIFLAEIIVFIPILIALWGTFSIPKKSDAASCLVTWSKLTNLVYDSSPDPGSLNPYND